VDLHGPVIPGANRRQHAPVDRSRQHEALVVVRVLANYVDPARSPQDTGWLLAIQAIEGSTQRLDPLG
jgi:hypothetical protein